LVRLIYWNQSAEAMDSDDSVEEHDQDIIGKEQKLITMDDR
jgi:hypothetical protein